MDFLKSRPMELGADFGVDPNLHPNQTILPWIFSFELTSMGRFSHLLCRTDFPLKSIGCRLQADIDAELFCVFFMNLLIKDMLFYVVCMAGKPCQKLP